MAWKVLLNLFLVLLPSVAGYSQGAPESRCESMRPDHGTRRTTYRSASTSQYTITVSGDGTYTAGQELQVEITASSGKDFRGFILQARKADGSVDPVGTFTSQQWGTETACDEGALTHSNARRKGSTSTSWTAPSESEGDIVFLATIVESYFSIYLNVKSTVIRDLELVRQQNAQEEIPASLNDTALVDPARCAEDLLQGLAAQRPHVAMLCSEDSQCPCAWRCCASCDVIQDAADTACAGHAICRQPLGNHSVPLV